jgi:hypothetical protein
MTLYKKLLYLGESHGVHDARFLAALNLKFNVTSYFHNDASLDTAPLRASYDLIVVSPMSKQLLDLSAGIDAIKIGICWAVEVNEVSYKQSEIEQINKILSDFSLIIFDADYVSHLFKSRFSFSGRIHKLYFDAILTNSQRLQKVEITLAQTIYVRQEVGRRSTAMN